MRTDQLIDALAADAATPSDAARPAALRARVLGAGALGLGLAAAAVALVLGIRPHLLPALGDAPVLLKFAGSAALAVSGLWLVGRAGEPGRPLRPVAAAAPVALVALGALALWPETTAAAWLPPTDRASLLCAASVAILALAPLGGLLAALRLGAPTRPRLAGAAAGLAAGGLGALGYALHCPIDAPGYVAFWYPAGVLTATALGALAGPRALAW